MKRFYFISDDLDDLERLEAELEDNGLQQPQIHVLSEDDAELARHREFMAGIENPLWG